jgi:hypothetical protein
MEEEFPKSEKKRSFRIEFLVGLCAIIISILTLFVYIYQARIMREQLHTAVWPYVQWMMTTGSEGFSISVMNKGVGPAIVKSTSLKLDGQPVPSVEVFLSKIIGKLDGLSWVETEINNQVISPGEELRLFHVQNNPALQKIDRKVYDRVQYKICFCSIYGDCWSSSGLNVAEDDCD